MAKINRLTVEITGAAGLSGKGVNVWHYSSADGASLAPHQTVCTHLTTFYTAIKTLYPSGANIQIATRVVQYGPPDLILGTTPASVTATGTGGSEPAQLSSVVAWRTIYAGPQFRGRSFLGPMCISAAQTNGAMNATLVTTMQNAATTLISNIASIGTDWFLVVYSRKHKTSQQVVAGSVNSAVKTLRRRA